MTTPTLSATNLKQMLRDAERQAQNLEHERQALALPALSGNAAAAERLSQVEAGISEAQATIARIKAGLPVAEAEETAAAEQAERERKDALRVEHARLLAERDRHYVAIEHHTGALVEAVHAALASGLQADTVASQLGGGWAQSVGLQTKADAARFILSRLDADLRPHIIHAAGRPLGRLTTGEA